jgi:hypothetical protein
LSQTQFEKNASYLQYMPHALGALGVGGLAYGISNAMKPTVWDQTKQIAGDIGVGAVGLGQRAYNFAQSNPALLQSLQGAFSPQGMMNGQMQQMQGQQLGAMAADPNSTIGDSGNHYNDIQVPPLQDQSSAQSFTPSDPNNEPVLDGAWTRGPVNSDKSHHLSFVASPGLNRSLDNYFKGYPNNWT